MTNGNAGRSNEKGVNEEMQMSGSTEAEKVVINHASGVFIDPDNEEQVTLLWHLYENVQMRYADGPDGLAEALREFAETGGGTDD
ncbi:unannotated protein [freshwater metagenome]|uniref:Unannotated protein n=1 Tax=freshwater metagenome TaxID=449393 RepID=A0A6J6RZ69_9ZZZZ